MITKLFTALYDEVLPDISGVGQSLALNAIRNAAIEFCDRSGCWPYNQSLLSSVASQPNYSFVPPADTEVVGVTQAWYNGEPIRFKSAFELEKEAINGNYSNLDFLPATLTAGPLTIGTKYQITGYVAGDDFTNVGATSNANGAVFTATGTTPTNWAGASVLSETQNLNATSTPWTDVIGTPSGFTIQFPDKFILVPMPQTAYTNSIKMTLSIKPTRTSTGMEQWVIDKYREEIAHGAKAKLFALPQKPWSNSDEARFHQAMFETGIRNASVMNTQTQLLPSMVTSPSPI